MRAEDPRTDADLIAAANRGDDTAFTSLYFRYRDPVARLARRFTGHDEDALDVLQETFAYLFGKFPGFYLTAALMTFLYPAVKNLSLAARRKRARFAGNAEPVDAIAAPQISAADPRRELAAVMMSLAEGHREVVLLRFVDGMTMDEIAAALGLPVGTVKSRLHHALSTLKEDARTRSYFETR